MGPPLLDWLLAGREIGWFWATAGDMEREPEEPVGEGVGRITCWGLGVPGGPEPMPLCAPPLELSLLFCPISSWCGEGDACEG